MPSKFLVHRRLTDSLSWYLLAGGLWNVWSESNHFSISISNYSVEINPELLGVGSVGQRNHLCDYVILSCCSLFYLFARKLVGWRMLTLALVLLSVELALSGSRSGFLYWLTTGFLVWLWRSMPDKIAYKRLLHSYLLFTVLFLFTQYLNSLISIWGGHASEHNPSANQYAGKQRPFQSFIVLAGSLANFLSIPLDGSRFW